jgi:DMSO/TMAO reductase YedYZ molybdopterin-dependent catalytic subunit
MRLDKAMDEDTLLAFRMNGEAIPPINGAPLRMVTPGWPGSLSQKWLTRIQIRDVVHDGAGMGGTSYRLPVQADRAGLDP